MVRDVPGGAEHHCKPSEVGWANGDAAQIRRPLWCRQKSMTNGCKAAESKANPLLAACRWPGLLGGGEVCARDSSFWVQMVVWRKAGDPFQSAKKRDQWVRGWSIGGKEQGQPLALARPLALAQPLACCWRWKHGQPVGTATPWPLWQSKKRGMGLLGRGGDVRFGKGVQWLAPLNNQVARGDSSEEVQARVNSMPTTRTAAALSLEPRRAAQEMALFVCQRP